MTYIKHSSAEGRDGVRAACSLYLEGINIPLFASWLLPGQAPVAALGLPPHKLAGAAAPSGATSIECTTA